MNDDALVTGEMVGLFFALGFDVVLIVGILWVFDYVSTTVLAAVTLLVVAVFGGWLLLRWLRLRGGIDADGTPESDGSEPDPVEKLKRRYARGELSDDEFEAGVDALLTDVDGDGTLDETDAHGEHEPERSERP